MIKNYLILPQRHYAVIGSAGKGQDYDRMTKDVFYKMVNKTEKLLEKETKAKITLVSGASSWSDHVAVYIFLKRLEKSPVNLTLHLPCRWCPITKRFDNESECGQRLNFLHSQFRRKTGIDPFWQISQALSNKQFCSWQITPGFKERNTKVANGCDIMIAFTFNDENPKEPKPRSGTRDTWDKCTLPKSNKIHFNLFEFGAKKDSF